MKGNGLKEKKGSKGEKKDGRGKQLKGKRREEEGVIRRRRKIGISKMCLAEGPAGDGDE